MNIQKIIAANKLWNESGGREGMRADLREANLSGADLSGANLRGADLSGANLRGAVGIWAVGPLGSRGDFLYGIQHANGVRYKVGCRESLLTSDELLAAVADEHGDNRYAVEYRAAIACIEAMAEAAKSEGDKQ